MALENGAPKKLSRREAIKTLGMLGAVQAASVGGQAMIFQDKVDGINQHVLTPSVLAEAGDLTEPELEELDEMVRKFVREQLITIRQTRQNQKGETDA